MWLVKPYWNSIIFEGLCSIYSRMQFYDVLHFTLTVLLHENISAVTRQDEF